MAIISHRSIPEVEMRPGIRGQFLASKEQGARGVCLLVNTADPGATVPLHKHSETPHAWGNAGGDIAKLLWAFAGPDPFRDSTYLEGLPPTCVPPDSCDAQY
jgi:hypothetical protein